MSITQRKKFILKEKQLKLLEIVLARSNCESRAKKIPQRLKTYVF